MPQFSLTSNGWHQVSYIWGPGHVLVSLRLNHTPTTEPRVEQVAPIGSCDHGVIDVDELRAAVLGGIHAANQELRTGFGCEAIRYVPNDTPRYDRYTSGARALVHWAASGGPAAERLPELVIDGERFDTWLEFLAEIDRVLISPGTFWGRNAGAFNDILRGGFGTPDDGFVLVWRNAGRSRQQLSEVDGYGATLFEQIVDIIRVHGPGGDEAADNVMLRLE